MAVARIDEEALAEKLGAVLPHLDERRRRLILAAEAGALGHGGIAVVARVAGAGRDTVRKGIRELEAGVPVSGRVRAAGAGRPPKPSDTDTPARSACRGCGAPAGGCRPAGAGRGAGVPGGAGDPGPS